MGAEVLEGSTRLKAGTAQKMICNMLTTGAMARLGYVYGNLMVHVQTKNAKLVERGIAIVRRVAKVERAVAVADSGSRGGEGSGGAGDAARRGYKSRGGTAAAAGGGKYSPGDGNGERLERVAGPEAVIPSSARNPCTVEIYEEPPEFLRIEPPLTVYSFRGTALKSEVPHLLTAAEVGICGRSGTPRVGHSALPP